MTAREQKKAAAEFAAYGFSPKASESGIVSRLFEMYAKLVG